MADKDALNDLINAYVKALNENDAKLAADCYAEADAVFMPQGMPTFNDMEEAYTGVFSAITLKDVVYTVDELVVMSHDYAYALTRGVGSQTIAASGETVPVSNREMFIFRKTDKGWKIARYMFNQAS